MALPDIKHILPYKLQLEDGERLGALDDPGPLPEGMHQNPTIHYSVMALGYRLENLPGVFIDSNTFVYYDQTNRNRRVSPDLYIALGVDTNAIEERHGYLIWEVGKPPDFVLEIASESTARNDCEAKRDLYAAIGVSEYWRYDLTGGDFYGFPLLGERLVNGEYRPYEVHTSPNGIPWSHSPLLNIHIYWGSRRLQVYDPDEDEMLIEYSESRRREKSNAAAHQAERNARLRTEAQRDEFAAQRDEFAAQRDDILSAYQNERQAHLRTEAQRDEFATQRDEFASAYETERQARLAERTRLEAEIARLREQQRPPQNP